ncbi:MAG: DUF308 domain-containing protein [Geobacteraceae bacterium]|nr:DUF308 domain-containing protein [Geobacteraceae bacterium]
MRHSLHSEYYRYELQSPDAWIRGLGIFLSVLGVLAIIGAFFTTMITVILLGIFLTGAGFLQLAYSFSLGFDSVLGRSSATVYLIVGIILLIAPVGSAIGLTFVFTLFFLVAGFIRLGYAVSARRMGIPSAWYFSGAALNLGLAVLVLVGLPETGTWVIGLLLGIELLFAGLNMIFLTSRLHFHSTV